MRQKAIQGLLSRFRWSPGPSIFDGFLADLNRALSALVSKIRPQNFENPPSPGGLLGDRGEWASTDANPACAPLKRNWGLGRGVGGLDELLGAWTSILGLGLGFWTLDKELGGLDK